MVVVGLDIVGLLGPLTTSRSKTYFVVAAAVWYFTSLVRL